MIQRYLAHIISYLLHPIFLPFYAILFLMWCNPFYFGSFDSRQGAGLLSVVLANSVIFPLLIMVILQKTKLIEDFTISDRKKRALPFLVMIFFLFWTYFVVKFRLQMPELLTDVMWGAFLSVMAAYFINVLYFKISLHAMGMGNFLAIIVIASFVSLYGLSSVLALGVLIAGIVGTARLILKAHTPQEIYVGYLVGFIMQMIAFIV